MESILWSLGYLAVGAGVTAALYKGLKVDWSAEAGDTKLLIMVTPIAWPLVLLLLGVLKFTR